jgi:hypothetical protein
MRKFWIVFISVELLALTLCQAARFKSGIALAAWATGVILLQPGEGFAELIHQRFFWMGPFSRLEGDTLELAIALLINALLWMLVWVCARALWRKMRKSKANA